MISKSDTFYFGQRKPNALELPSEAGLVGFLNGRTGSTNFFVSSKLFRIGDHQWCGTPVFVGPLGGGNSKIFWNFHPEKFGENDPI